MDLKKNEKNLKFYREQRRDIPFLYIMWKPQTSQWRELRSGAKPDKSFGCDKKITTENPHRKTLFTDK